MDAIRVFLNASIFRFSTLGWADVLDLFLVGLTFFLVFQLLRRSQAASILRGLMILAAVLVAFTLLLPLPTFGTVVQVVAIASLIVIPIILQPELRRWLERLGRNRGLFGTSQLSQVEQNIRSLLRATEEMSATNCGGLIALEGRDNLQSYIDGGIEVRGQLTAELLQSIFYGENPLHDGAVVVRAHMIEAASCVLPLAQEVPVARRRLGTRHRAAVGVTEVSDALSIVVSEETGAISTARFGRLAYDLNSIQLRQAMLSFYADPDEQSVRRQWAALLPWRRGDHNPITIRAVLSQLGYLLLSALLALALWGAVATQQNPIRQITVPGVPLTVVNRPPDWVLISPVPETVGLVVQTDDVTVATISPRSFEATVDLAGAALGLQRLPVTVVTAARAVRILSVDPAEIDVNLSATASRTLPTTVVVTDPESLPPSYQLVGKPVSNPPEVTLSGPAALVDDVVRAEVQLALNGTTSPVRTLLPVNVVNEAGGAVTGLTIGPSQVLVTANIRRQNNLQDVGVRVVTEGAPPDGYWVSSVVADPPAVTLRGAPEDLAELDNFVLTVPVDISDIRGEFRTQSPLQLPPTLTALDSDGRVISTVEVVIETTPLLGELVLTRPVRVQGLPTGTVVTVDPATVQILISGPVPILSDIERNPDLVQVLVDGALLLPGSSITVTPEVINPPNTVAQLIDQSVILSREP